jgi:hypothetical protein
MSPSSSSFDATAFALEFADAPSTAITAPLSEGLAQLLASTASAECRIKLASDGSLNLLAGTLQSTLAAW